MSEPPDPEVSILNVALELCEPERIAYLDQACAGDAGLRKRVEELLRAHEHAKDFLNAPPSRLDFRKTDLTKIPLTEKPGDRIGRYKLLQQIGEGGCGVVYMAEQEEPVRRRVALKVIKLGMDTKSVIARFEAERQALALMEHPNIAKVLDAGATDTGRPYFVMELVRGVKITEFCDENKLSTEERLNLFIQVCQAVQHAHQKGIIHRDIKPSNILVTVNDGVPVPKVIDFGIAKATAGRLTDKTLFTAFEQFIGTPAYMSPEQAAMTSLDIDTRSDIYSLGVLLYELLTGKTPFDQKELLATGLDEMRRTIREKEPPKPSTRLSSLTSEELTTVAQRRQIDAPKLVYRVRGDLDWIVMKCLEKERGRRYETANGLAADIRRHLNIEPIVARPRSKFYEFQRTVQRHKLGFAAAASLIVMLVLGIVTTSWQAIRATRAERQQLQLRKEADQASAEESIQRQKAEAGQIRSEATARFMSEMLRSAGPSVARGRDATLLQEIMEKTATRVGNELTNQPEVQGDVFVVLGNTFADIGEMDRAAEMFEKSLPCYRRAFNGDNPKLAITLGNYGSALSWRGRINEGTNYAGLGLEMARRLGDSNTLAICLYRYGQSLTDWGKGSPKAVPYLQEALAIRKAFGSNSPALVSVLRALSVSVTNDAEGLALAREVLQASQGLADYEPSGTAAAYIHFVLGQKLLDVERPEEAETELRQALTLWRTVFDPKHPYRVVVFRYFIESLALQGKWSAAEVEIQTESGLAAAGTENFVTLRAALQIREGQWEQAVDLLKGNNILNTATALALQGAVEIYRQQSRSLMSRTPMGTNYVGMERAALTALLLPPEPLDLERAGRMADAIVQTQDDRDFAPWGSMTKSLAEYRRGNFQLAIEWSGRAIAATNAALPCLAAARFIQAMAYQSANQIQSAQTALAAGKEVLKAFIEGGMGHDGVILEHWTLADTWTFRAWQTAEILHREAEKLLPAPPASSQEK